MQILGHLTQVAHLAFIGLMQHWLGFGWGSIVFLSLSALSMLMFGDCAFTIVANWCFAQSNHPGYTGCMNWLRGRKRI